MASLRLHLVIHACWARGDLVWGGHDKSPGFPRVAAILLIIGVVPVAVWHFVLLPLPYVLLGVAVAWLGLTLFRVGGEGARQATPRVR